MAGFLNPAEFHAKSYAPCEWKREVLGFDLPDLRPWLAQVANTKDDLDFHDVCVRYAARLKSGGHGRFPVPLTFSARLGFTVDIQDGKTPVDSIDRTRLPAAEFPFQTGDELVSVDGRSTEELIREFEPYGVMPAPISARRPAAQTITIRTRRRMPRLADLGDTATVVIRRQSGESESWPPAARA
jgi:hypothetical protein